jgi:hypothetical protein
MSETSHILQWVHMLTQSFGTPRQNVDPIMLRATYDQRGVVGLAAVMKKPSA